MKIENLYGPKNKSEQTYNTRPTCEMWFNKFLVFYSSFSVRRVITYNYK